MFCFGYGGGDDDGSCPGTDRRPSPTTTLFYADPSHPWTGDVLVFDTECVVPPDTTALAQPETCRVYDVSVRNMTTGAHFTTYVDPQWDTYPTPSDPALFPVTAAFLRRHEAQPFAAVVDALVAFAGTNRPVAWVAHGCFVLDKRVLEAEFARLGRAMPGTWYFYDTLPLFRRRWKGEKTYRLGALFTGRMGHPPHQTHRAADDTATLATLVYHATHGGSVAALTGGFYPPLLTPLQTVKYIGSQAERLLYAAGYTCVEDLFMTLTKPCRLHVDRMAAWLDTTVPGLTRGRARRIARSVLKALLRRTVDRR